MTRWASRSQRQRAASPVAVLRLTFIDPERSVVSRSATSIPATRSVPESCRGGTSRELHRAAGELSAAFRVAKTTMGSKASVYGPQSRQPMVPFNL